MPEEQGQNQEFSLDPHHYIGSLERKVAQLSMQVTQLEAAVNQVNTQLQEAMVENTKLREAIDSIGVDLEAPPSKESPKERRRG